MIRKRRLLVALATIAVVLAAVPAEGQEIARAEQAAPPIVAPRWLDNITSAQLGSPWGVVVDGEGNIYATDTSNH